MNKDNLLQVICAVFLPILEGGYLPSTPGALIPVHSPPQAEARPPSSCALTLDHIHSYHLERRGGAYGVT